LVRYFQSRLLLKPFRVFLVRLAARLAQLVRYFQSRLLLKPFRVFLARLVARWVQLPHLARSLRWDLPRLGFPESLDFLLHRSDL
jgi:hypothetical protein